jgi:hypothetical protein
MIPTMSFRWLVPSFEAYGEQPDCRRLQQLFHTSSGDKWIDVRMVSETQEERLAAIAEMNAEAKRLGLE